MILRSSTQGARIEKVQIGAEGARNAKKKKEMAPKAPKIEKKWCRRRENCEKMRRR